MWMSRLEEGRSYHERELVLVTKAVLIFCLVQAVEKYRTNIYCSENVNYDKMNAISVHEVVSSEYRENI